MRRISSFFIFAFVLFCSDAFGQSAVNGDKLLLENYNNFLKGVEVSEDFLADKFSIIEHFTTSESGNKRKVNVLRLLSNQRHDSAISFADALSKLTSLDSNSILLNSLLFKLSDYLGTAPNNVVLEICYRKSEKFRLTIYYDKGIRLISNLPGVKESGIPDGPGNPEDDLYGGVISGIQPGINFRTKLEKGLGAYLKGLPVEKSIDIGFLTADNNNVLRIEVRGLKGAVTPGYREQLFLTIFIVPSHSGRVDANFLFTVLYSSGIISTANNKNLKDAALHYDSAVRDFGQKLKENIRKISRL